MLFASVFISFDIDAKAMLWPMGVQLCNKTAARRKESNST